jgi:hypothetical protein
MKRIFILTASLLTGILLAGLLFSSCGQGKTKEKKPLQRLISNSDFKPGVVYDSVKCAGHPGESYTLYLPQHFDSSRRFPVIFFFDAQARGTLPVKRYKPLADRFGFILAASNNSKNGLSAQVRNRYIYDFMADVEKRLPLDARRIYTGGFSGGARIAAGIGLSNAGIAGTIGCAAGFPSLRRIVNKQLAYAGIVGNTDFNYMEMKQLATELSAAHWQHCLLVFDGHHQWPPVQTMKKAFYFLQTDAMRRGFIPADRPTLQSLDSLFRQDRKKAVQNKDLLMQWNTDGLAIAFLHGLSDVSFFKNDRAELEKNPALKKCQQKQEMLFKEEQNRRQFYAKALAGYDMQWWKKALSDLARMKKNAAGKQRSLMIQRLYNYLSLISYLYADGSLKNGNTTAAEKYLMIYRFVDPDNPEVYYLQAHLFALTGEKPQKILVALQTAADKGFYDIKRFTSDPLFVSLHQNPLYQKIRMQIKNNPEKEM